jgi:hypothetical protein
VAQPGDHILRKGKSILLKGDNMVWLEKSDFWFEECDLQKGYCRVHKGKSILCIAINKTFIKEYISCKGKSKTLEVIDKDGEVKSKTGEAIDTNRQVKSIIGNVVYIYRKGDILNRYYINEHRYLYNEKSPAKGGAGNVKYINN